MSASFAPCVRSSLEREPFFGAAPSSSSPAWLQVGLAGLRWLAAGIAVLVLAGCWIYVSARVDANAAHLCGWPATISCEPSPVWTLVTGGFGLTAAFGVLTALTWAAVNRGGFLTTAYPLWIVVFLVLVHETGPRQFDQSDLVLLGGFAGLAIELLRRSAVLWMPKRRQLWSTAAISSALVYAVLLSLVPSHLANLAG